MTNIGGKLGAGFATAAGILATLAILGLLLASAPNTSPEQWALLQRLMLGTGAGGLAACVAAIVLIVKGRTRVGGWIGAVPMLALIVLIAWVLIA